MANTLTNLIPDLTEALNVVSREKVGYIPAVKRDSEVARAAQNQNVQVPLAAAASSANNTAAVNAPDTGDETTDSVSLTISKSKHVPIRFNGEERKGLSNSGLYSSLLVERTAEAIRTLTNEIELDCHNAAYKAASRATGTPGTAPFATADDLDDLAAIAEILDDNGCPSTDRQIVLSNASMRKLRGKQSSLFKVNEAGSSEMLRDGMIGRLEGFAVRQSGQASSITAGTGASYQASAAHSEGDTTINVDTGSGTILAGDIVTIGSHKYVAKTALSGGSFTISAPGLQADVADNATVTVNTTAFKSNVAFDRSAIILATRMPALPEEGDAAADVTQIQDPYSGIVYEFALYKQFLQNVIHVRLAWGAGAVKGNHIANLVG